MASFDDAVLFTSPETYAVGARVLPNRLIFRYDTSRWDFRALVSQFFETDELETLHLSPRFNPRTTADPLPNYETTKNSWAISKQLQEAVAPAADRLFRGLLYEHVSEFLYPVAGHQPVAALRVNFHGSKAILRFHADSEYGQAREPINLWLPATRVWGANSMHLESDVGRADFAPLELEYGQACIFRGTELVHGTVDNDSGSTRISYDIRFRVKQP
jgi:hypothetical protein